MCGDGINSARPLAGDEDSSGLGIVGLMRILAASIAIRAACFGSESAVKSPSALSIAIALRCSRSAVQSGAR